MRSEQLDKVMIDIDTMYNIAFTILREERYRIKNQIISNAMNNEAATTAVMVNSIERINEIQMRKLTYCMEELHELRKLIDENLKTLEEVNNA